MMTETSQATIETSESDTVTPSPRVHHNWWIAGSVVVVLGVAFGAYGAGIGDLLWGSDPAPVGPTPGGTVAAPDAETPAEEETVAETPTATPEEVWRRDVLGRWKTYYKGDRYMTVRDDGTATIEAHLVEYSWFEKKVVGTDHVVFEIVWTIEDGALTFDTVGGEPAASVNVITSIHGKSKTYPIVHVTDDEFRYKSDDPEDDDYVWERLPAE